MKKFAVSLLLVVLTLGVFVTATAELEITVEGPGVEVIQLEDLKEKMVFNNDYPLGKNIHSYEKGLLDVKQSMSDGMLYIHVENWATGERYATVRLGDWREILERGIPTRTAHFAWITLTGGYLDSEEENEDWVHESVPYTEFMLSLSDFVI
jgi:hypothetical protein